MAELMIRRLAAGSTADAAVTRALVDAAFRPEDVASFLDRLRGDGCLIGEWLAESAGATVGLIAFARVHVQTDDGDEVAAAMLTPLAVQPEWQRQGIGTRLMAAAHAELEARGETLFLVLGHPEYYPRAGYRSELGARIASPWPRRSFMARGAVVPRGRLLLPTALAGDH